MTFRSRRLRLPILTVAVLLVAFGQQVRSEGNTWQTLGPAGKPINALVSDPTDPHTLYVASNNSTVYKSTDAGGSWTPLALGTAGLTVQALALDASALFAGTNGGGVFRSSDGGASWQPAEPGAGDRLNVTALLLDPAHPGTLYAGTNLYPFRSQDGGATWIQLKGNLTNAQSMSVALTPAALYDGTGGNGLYRSDDGGETWTVSTRGLTIPVVRAIVLDPNAPGVIYLATPGGVFVSSDDRQSWSARNRGMSGVYIQTLLRDPASGALYAGAAPGGVYVSSDGGETWSAINTGLKNDTITAFALAPATADTAATLYAGTPGGVFALALP